MLEKLKTRDDIKEFHYLIRNGKFFRAYSTLAKMISKIMGYKLSSCTTPKDGETVMVGFPSSKITDILTKLTSNYGTEVIQYTQIYDNLYIIHLYEIPDLDDITVSGVLPNDLTKKILELDLTKTTPFDALGILTKIQEECKKYGTSK